MKVSNIMNVICSFKSTYLGLAVLLALAAVPTVSQERASLDLTKVRVHDLPIQSTIVRGGESLVGDGHSGSTTQQDPLSIVVLVPADGTDIRAGDEFTWEIKIKNNGYQPINLPWDPNLADFQPKNKSSNSSFSGASLAFSFNPEKGETFALSGTVILYGSPDVKGSMLSLHPKEWARIRGKAMAAPQIVSEHWSKLKQSGLQTTMNLQVGVAFSSVSLKQESGGFKEYMQTFGKVSVTSQPVRLTLSFQ